MSVANGRKVRLGEREVPFPSEYLQPLQDCNSIIDNRDALLQELNSKGYLFIRGLHDRDEVLEARRAVLEYILASGEAKLDADHPVEAGILHQRCGLGCVPFMEGISDITHHEKVQRVLEGERPRKFFTKLFGEECKTFDYKWLRGMHRHGYTGAHVDNVYMSWGTSELYTMWTPFDDVTVDMGTLAVCEASNSLTGFKPLQDTYGNFDTEKSNHQGTGWFTTDPFEITSMFGGQWKTSDFQAGDVIIFGMRTLHMSTANLTDKVRISCDTRWLRASAQADPRYMGLEFKSESKFGVWHDKAEKQNGLTMQELRAMWKL